MKFRAAFILLSVAVLLAPVGVGAKLCGDNVGGQDVPCACGDTVVSSLTLGNDPVLDGVCPADGLIVRVPAGSVGVTIDLQGKTLQGSGNGAGVWVISGGTGGARVVSTGGPATIEGFRDGILGHGADTVRLIDGIVVLQSTRDGMRIGGENYEIRNSEVRNSGRDGYGAMGKGFHLTATRAVHSGRFAYFVMGQDASLGAPGAGIVADGSGAAGFAVMGMGHHLIDCTVSGSGKEGIHLNGMHYEIRGCQVRGSGGDGIGGMGMDWTFGGNQAIDNDGNGILVGGHDVVDAGGNSGSGNRGLRQQRPAVQCEIDGRPCRP